MPEMTETEFVAKLAVDGTKPEEFIRIDGRPVYAHGQRIFTLSEATATSVYDPEGFITAVGRYRSDEIKPSVFVDTRGLAVTAILNDGDDGEPGWRDHRVSFSARKTPRWDFWVGHQGLVNPKAFAEVLQEGQKEIVSPSVADMLELAQSLKATVDARVSAGHNISTGARNQGVEEIIQVSGKDDIEVPALFTLAVDPIEGSQIYEVEALIRTQVSTDGGKLSIGYTISREQDYIDTAFEDIVKVIREGIEDADFINGPVPDSRIVG